MYALKKLERYLLVNLLGLGPRFLKKNLPGRGLTKVEKHCFKLHQHTHVRTLLSVEVLHLT